MSTKAVVVGRDRRRTAALLAGAWTAALVGAFENTGMRPAYPQILEELGGGTDVSVFSTTFMVGGFVTAMLFAKTVRRTTVIRMFWCATVVQIVGLALCLGADDLPTFLLGRLVQGAGEGVLVTCVFFCISTFLPPGRARSLGYASVSAAWLLASSLAPVVYLTERDRPWNLVLVLLIMGSAGSLVFIGLGRRCASRDDSSLPDRAPGRVTTVAACVQLGLIAVALFAYSQFAGALGSILFVVVAGILVLVSVVLGSFRGHGLLRIQRGVSRFLFVRGVVSAVYSAGLSFASVALVASADVHQAGIAVVTSLAAVGWTAGALLQSRLRLREQGQLCLGLLTLAVGLVTFVGGLHAPLWFCGSGMLCAGVGIGIAANALPGFVASVVPEDELAESLTGLEVVDTVSTTVVLVIVGTVLSGGDAGRSPADGAIGVVYCCLAACAASAGIWIARLRRSAGVTLVVDRNSTDRPEGNPHA